MTQLDETQPASVIEAPRRTLDLRAVTQSRPWLPALVTAVILLVVGQVLSPGFASWNGLNQVLAAAAILAIASCGQTLVMISGDYGIDLSVGQVMSLTAIAGYMSMKGGSDYLAVGLLVAVLVGGLLGALSGVLVSCIRLPALVVTLGTMVVAQGIQMVLASNGTPQDQCPHCSTS